MKVFKVRLGVLATVTGLALLGAGVTTAQASKPPEHKVTICHRTGSVAGGNTHAGYSVITVDIAAVGNAKSVRGHDGHDQVGNGPDGDIIPAYTYRTYTYPGKNLANGGAELLANDCKSATPSASSTTSATTPPVTTTTSATTPPVSSTTSATTPPVSSTTSETTPPVTTTTPVDVLGAAASENPLPAGAAAGQANTGTLVGAGLTGLTALLALGAGFILRRRHGVS